MRLALRLLLSQSRNAPSDYIQPKPTNYFGKQDPVAMVKENSVFYARSGAFAIEWHRRPSWMDFLAILIGVPATGILVQELTTMFKGKDSH